EGNRGLPQPRCDDRSTLGETGGHARSPASARPDGLGLPLSGGVGRLGARPESSRSAGERERTPSRARPRATASRRTASATNYLFYSAKSPGLACGGGSYAGYWRRPLVAKDGIRLAQPDRRRSISDGHGLRRG